MSIRRLPDKNKRRECHHAEHGPPMFISLPNGDYEHTCPGCGDKTYFSVNTPTFTSTSGLIAGRNFTINETSTRKKR